MRGQKVLCLGVALWGAGVGLACAGSIDGSDTEEPGAPGQGAGAAKMGTVAGDGKGGAAGTPSPAPGMTVPGATGGSNPVLPAGADSAGPMPLRRLTRAEYRNTIRDLQLVSNPSDLTREMPEDARGAFGFDVASIVSNVEVDRFLGAAEAIGKAVAASPTRLAQVLGCNPQQIGEEACARDFVAKFGRRAYRRPLASDEVEALVAYYRQVRGDLKYDFTSAARVVLQVMLQSPSFLYRWELGPQAPRREGGLVRLSPHEVAARLSYFLWSTMPDAKLAAAADAGGLQTPAEVAAEAQRMVADPKAKDTIASFHDQWLGLDELASVQKDPKLLPTFRSVLDAMAVETRTFVSNLFAEGGGKLETLIAAPYSFLNEALAKHYGVPGVVGREYRKVELDPAQRLGMLTQGSFLAIHSPPNTTSPVRRGKIVLEHFMCDPPPPPPEGLEVAPPPPDPKLQVREQFVMHTTEPSCRACHARMDGIGFTFEGHDTLGRWRTEEAGRPVDTTATIPALDGADRTVRGATELVRLLARSEQVRACMVKQWMRFALGRLETPDEAGSLRAAFEELARSGHDVRALLVGLTRTKAFLYRTPFPWEVP